VREFWGGLLRRSWLVVAVFAAATALMLVGAGRIEMDSSADAINPEHNAIVELNDAINKEFNSGRTEVFVLYADDVFAPERLAAIREITAELESVAGVLKVTSLANMTKMVERDGVLEASDMVPEGEIGPRDVADIKGYVASNFMLKSGLLTTQDGAATLVIVEFEDSADLPSIVAAMERPVRDHWAGKYDLAGIPSLESYLLATLHRDLPLLGGIALAIIVGLFLLNYRSLLGAALPVLQILVGLVWGAGGFGWLGLKFQQLTIIAPVAILAVGSSFTIHLLGRYFLELSRGTPKREAILRVLDHTGIGVLVSGAAITASIMTFQLSSLAMIRGLGVFIAAGVFSCMLSSLFLLPAILDLAPEPKVRVDMEASPILSRGLRRLGDWTTRYPKRIAAVAAAILAVSAFGITRIVPNTALVAFFRADSPVILGMNAVNRTFHGSTTAKVLVSGDLKDPELLQSMLDFQEAARSIRGVGCSTSIASLVRSIHETLTGEAALPKTEAGVAQELLVYQASGASLDDITSLSNLGYSEGIVNFIVPRLSTPETKALFDRLGALAKACFGSRAEVKFAGDVLSETALEEVLIHDFVVSLTLALILVILIDSLIRSVRAALVTITVLVSTIILQYGVLGLTGSAFNMATALVGALAIGVGDYAIHLTVRYMEDRRSGLSPEDSVKLALLTSGRSIFYTALTIGGGFVALTFSRLVPVATLGRIMVMTVVIVGAASLTLLPAACVLFLRNPIKSHLEVKEDE